MLVRSRQAEKTPDQFCKGIGGGCAGKEIDCSGQVIGSVLYKPLIVNIFRTKTSGLSSIESVGKTLPPSITHPRL